MNAIKNLEASLLAEKTALITNLEKQFKSSKIDINSAWSNTGVSADILNKRLTGDWIYSVDPETMSYVKFIYKYMMPQNYSLMNVFCEILKVKNFKELSKNFKN